MEEIINGQDQSESENARNNQIEVRGKTVEEAVQEGLAQLNLSADEVEVQILQEGSRGIFGFGAEDAVVRLVTKMPATPVAEATVAQPFPKTEPVSPEGRDEVRSDEVRSDEVRSDEVRSDVSAPPEEAPDGAEFTPVQLRAKEVLETLLEKMSIEAQVVIRSGEELVEPDEEWPLSLNIEGDDLGILIGRRSETLNALQFIVRQILSKDEGQRVPVVIDVGSYLVRRRKSLKQLADRMADKVVASKTKVTLEPMPGRDRRIVHLQLRDHEGVYTQSIGENERRKVEIYPKHP